MVDSKTVTSQIQEYQVLLDEIQAKGMVIRESLQVVVAIEKLPPSWKDFKSYLNYNARR